MAATRNGRLFNCMQKRLHTMMILNAGSTFNPTADIHTSRPEVLDSRAHSMGIQSTSEHQSPAFDRHLQCRRDLMATAALLAWRMTINQQIAGIGIRCAEPEQLVGAKSANAQCFDPRQPKLLAECG